MEEGVVTIYSETKGAIGASGSGQGTGFFISSDGDILTAYHVIAEATELSVFTHGGESSKSVSLVAALPEYDLAIIRADGLNRFRYFSITRSIPEASDRVTIVGSPRGLPSQIIQGYPTFSGTISSLRLSASNGRAIFKRAIEVIPLDITVYNRLSGAPVLDASSSVVGVLSGSFDEGRGLAWSIPIHYLDEMNRGDPVKVNGSILWPKFDLMSNSWRSLKRSYEETFSARHIQELEILELIAPKIVGAWSIGRRWNANMAKNRRRYYCGSGSEESTFFRIDGVDREKATIVGKVVIETSRGAMKFEILNEIFDWETKSEREWCESLSGSGRDRVQTGSIEIRPFRRSSNEIEILAYIDECEPNCSGGWYGEEEIGIFEVVSRDVMKDGSDVARRQ